MLHNSWKLSTGLFGGLMLMAPALSNSAMADIAVIGIDRKVVNESGKTITVKAPGPDSVMILDIASIPPKVIAEVEAPISVVGPPSTVAVAPDESIAIATGGRVIDPDKPTGPPKVADHVTVIDLKASPPTVVARLTAGAGAAGVSFTPDGKMALVADRNAGTVSVFGVDGKNVTCSTRSRSASRGQARVMSP